MNQSLISKRFEYLVHSLEERSEKNVQQNLYEYLLFLIYNIQGREVNLHGPMIFFRQSNVSVFARNSNYTIKGSNPDEFQLSREMERFETFTACRVARRLYTVYNIYPGEHHARPLASHERGTSNNLRALSAISRDKATGYCSRRKEKKKKKKKENK